MLIINIIAILLTTPIEVKNKYKLYIAILFRLGTLKIEAK